MNTKILTTCQLTSTLFEEINEKFGSNVEVRASCPAFNVKNAPMNPTDIKVTRYDIPAYHPVDKSAVFKLVSSIDNSLNDTSKVLGFGLNDFVIGKANMADAFVDWYMDQGYLEHYPDTAPYLQYILTVKNKIVEGSKAVASEEDLISLLSSCGLEWDDVMENLHFTNVLKLFGFSADLAKEIAMTPYKKATGKTAVIEGKSAPVFKMVTIGEEYLKWISNLLTFYQVVGSIADPANALAAVLNKSGSDAVITEMVKAIANDDLKDDFWVPDVMIMDSEKDDFSALVILQHLNPDLQVIVQLPSTTSDEFTDIMRSSLADFHISLGHEVFYDVDSLNHKALAKVV
jgi:hypothetical protein